MPASKSQQNEVIDALGTIAASCMKLYTQWSAVEVSLICKTPAQFR